MSDTPIINTTATEGETKPVVKGPSVFKRALNKTKTLTVDPTVAVATGVRTSVKKTWRNHKAYQLAKETLKDQMTEEGLQLLKEQEERDAELRAAKEAIKAAKAEQLAKIKEFQDQIERLEKEMSTS